MANTLLTISMITREAARVLVNNLVTGNLINRSYDDKFGVEGAKIGTILNVRKPPRYIGRVGQALQIEDATETSVPVALTTQRGVDIAFSSQDLALSIDDFKKRFISPAVASVANAVDFDILQLYKTVYNEIGTPGTVPNQMLTYLQVNQRLSEEAAPFEDRNIVVSPAMNATIVDALKGLFQAGDKIREQYNKGMMGQGLGFDGIFVDQNVPTQVVGPLGGSPAVNGAGQTGNSLITNGWTASAAKRLSAGDVITAAGCFAVNPQSRQSTGVLRQFVVTADVSSDGSGNATIPIFPAIVTSGPFQNCSASPTTTGAITVQGAANTSSPRGLAFHKDAFTLATADLPLPGGVDMAARVSDKELGISIRMVRAYDINLDRFPCRLDFLYGTAAIYPELACRLAS